MSGRYICDAKDAVRIKVKKCDGLMQPSYKKFHVDPQLTSFEILQSLLATCFNLTSDFTISYLARDPVSGDQIYLSLLSDWDLDAAFEFARHSQDNCLRLRVDLRPFEEGLDDWDVIGPRDMISNSRSSPGANSAGSGGGRDSRNSFLGSLTDSMKHQVGTAVSHVQKAIGLKSECDDDMPLPRSHKPLMSDAEFRHFLDSDGRLVQAGEFRLSCFRGGVEPSLRKVVWRHLLNVYPEGLTGQERYDYFRRKSEEYYRLRDEWQSTLKAGPISEELKFVTNMIKKDVIRTDRAHKFYAGSDENKNLVALFNLLTTYALAHPDISYCQGMSDLASPLLVVERDEAHAYICFSGLMRRVRRNFTIDGLTMTVKFQHLALLLQHYDAELYEYLKEKDADDLFFCYRWLLLELKREFPLEDALLMLETMWASMPHSPPEGDLPLSDRCPSCGKGGSETLGRFGSNSLRPPTASGQACACSPGGSAGMLLSTSPLVPTSAGACVGSFSNKENVYTRLRSELRRQNQARHMADGLGSTDPRAAGLLGVNNGDIAGADGLELPRCRACSDDSALGGSELLSNHSFNVEAVHRERHITLTPNEEDKFLEESMDYTVHEDMPAVARDLGHKCSALERALLELSSDLGAAWGDSDHMGSTATEQSIEKPVSPTTRFVRSASFGVAGDTNVRSGWQDGTASGTLKRPTSLNFDLAFCQHPSTSTVEQGVFSANGTLTRVGAPGAKSCLLDGNPSCGMNETNSSSAKCTNRPADGAVQDRFSNSNAAHRPVTQLKSNIHTSGSLLVSPIPSSPSQDTLDVHSSLSDSGKSQKSSQEPASDTETLAAFSLTRGENNSSSFACLSIAGSSNATLQGRADCLHDSTSLDADVTLSGENIPVVLDEQYSATVTDPHLTALEDPSERGVKTVGLSKFYIPHGQEKGRDLTRTDRQGHTDGPSVTTNLKGDHRTCSADKSTRDSPDAVSSSDVTTSNTRRRWASSGATLQREHTSQSRNTAADQKLTHTCRARQNYHEPDAASLPGCRSDPHMSSSSSLRYTSTSAAFDSTHVNPLFPGTSPLGARSVSSIFGGSCYAESCCASETSENREVSRICQNLVPVCSRAEGGVAERLPQFTSNRPTQGPSVLHPSRGLSPGLQLPAASGAAGPPKGASGGAAVDGPQIESPTGSRSSVDYVDSGYPDSHLNSCELAEEALEGLRLDVNPLGAGVVIGDHGDGTPSKHGTLGTATLLDTGPHFTLTNSEDRLTYSRSGVDLSRLPAPCDLGLGNPFLMFLCVTLFLQHRDIIMAEQLDYNEIAMYFDKLVRKHDVRRVLARAQELYTEYLKFHRERELLVDLSCSGSFGERFDPDEFADHSATVTVNHSSKLEIGF